jgi:hypothetical protein
MATAGVLEAFHTVIVLPERHNFDAVQAVAGVTDRIIAEGARRTVLTAALVGALFLAAWFAWTSTDAQTWLAACLIGLVAFAAFELFHLGDANGPAEPRGLRRNQ